MVAEHGIRSFNLYDLYANVLPGLLLIFGLVLPLKIVPTLRLILGADVSPEFGIAYLLLLLALAYLAGHILQAIGGRVDADHGIDHLFQTIINGNNYSRIPLTEVDHSLWEKCKTEFDISDEFNQYERVWKMILAYLEAAGRSRALRLQALYLFARGAFITTALLIIYYGTLLITFLFSYFPGSWSSYFRVWWVNIWLLLFAVIGSFFLRYERDEWESDWIKYTIIEFHLETIE
jgi:hypothetical protein